MSMVLNTRPRYRITQLLIIFIVGAYVNEKQRLFQDNGYAPVKLVGFKKSISLQNSVGFDHKTQVVTSHENKQQCDSATVLPMFTLIIVF